MLPAYKIDTENVCLRVWGVQTSWKAITLLYLGSNKGNFEMNIHANGEAAPWARQASLTHVLLMFFDIGHAPCFPLDHGILSPPLI